MPVIVHPHETDLPSWLAGRRQIDRSKSTAAPRAGLADGQSRQRRSGAYHLRFRRARLLGAGALLPLRGAACGGNARRAAAGTTFCYAEPDDLEKYEEFEAILRQYDSEMLPVFLHCSREEAMRRVGNSDRVERRKLTSTEGLINYLDSNNFTSVPREDCVKLDTGTMPAETAAAEIVRRYQLSVLRLRSPRH